MVIMSLAVGLFQEIDEWKKIMQSTQDRLDDKPSQAIIDEAALLCAHATINCANIEATVDSIDHLIRVQLKEQASKLNRCIQKTKGILSQRTSCVFDDEELLNLQNKAFEISCRVFDLKKTAAHRNEVISIVLQTQTEIEKIQKLTTNIEINQILNYSSDKLESILQQFEQTNGFCLQTKMGVKKIPNTI